MSTAAEIAHAIAGRCRRWRSHCLAGPRVRRGANCAGVGMDRLPFVEWVPSAAPGSTTRPAPAAISCIS